MDVEAHAASATKAATIRDVARLAGVSHQTVSRYFEGETGIRESTRARVADPAATLRFHPSAAARSLATKRSNRLGALAYGLTDVGPSKTLRGAERGGAPSGIPPRHRQPHLVRRRPRRARAAPPLRHTPPAAVRQLVSERGTARVAVNRRARGSVDCEDEAVTVRVGSVVMGASDVRRAMRFWMTALGYVPRDEPDDTWVVLTPPSGAGPNISLGLSQTPVQDRPRVHLDLYTADQAGEVDRLLALGATRVDWQDYPPDADFVVLADTEGNRFCLIDHD